MNLPNLTLPVLLLALCGCTTLRPTPETAQSVPCPACPICPTPEPPKPAAKPLQAAEWRDLPGWENEDHASVLALWRTSCSTLAKRPLWRASCEALPKVDADGTLPSADARDWFEREMRPWTLTNPDGTQEGLITGYYEPLIKGSRKKQKPYLTPVFGPPDDLIVVELDSLYPELKNMRLRGRIEGRKLVPYYDRAAWTAQEPSREAQALLWVDNPVDFFFLQVQGSGQVEMADGSRVRIGYADQNGHPYRAIAKWLIDKGEIRTHEASMQGIKAWAEKNPKRLQELLNANPSVVFFRELPVTGDGPPGALGISLTPERSIAVDPRHVPLGAPVWLSTTRPNTDTPLARTMLAQDTGGAIRGPVRADFYWGSGPAAGNQAGKMKQRGRMWVVLPKEYEPVMP